jgi:glycine/D-amino acid oxidase-like deaminating enzyme
MDRRTLLQLFAGVAVAGVRSSAFQSARRDRVVIAGGGILGANIAYRLATRGASVTLLERSTPGTGATANSFAWLNAKKQPRAYFTLNQLGIAGWRALDQELGGALPLVWGGSVEWTTDAERASRVAEVVRRYQSWGYPIHQIDDAQLRALEKNLTTSALRLRSGQAVANAFHAEIEGNVDPVAATEIIIARAAKAGARIQHAAAVTGLDLQAGRLRAVRTSVGDIEADVLVIACGTDTPKVAAMAGISVPLTHSPGILVHTVPQPRVVDRVILSPLGQIKQKANGRIVTGADFGPTTSEDTSREYGEGFLRRMAAVLPPLAKMPVEKVTLGFRPMPKDGYPIIGSPAGHPDIYITVMHSGMTLAPAIGRLAESEILDRADVDLLKPYRLERFSA